jgi:spermidine/putrescine transport system substrate-binding protein
VVFKYFIRLFMLLSCIGLIYGFLMLPYVFKNKEQDAKSLRIYTWANRINETVLQDFEQKTGIKVYLNYFESAEELLTKLEVMPFMDCDIMLPSSYVIKPMIEAGLIKKLDRSRCPFIKKIYPQFLNMAVDPNNEYSLPLYWDVFGLGYNANMVKDAQVTLKLLFDKSCVIGKEVAMTDEPREAIFLTAEYLGLNLDHLRAYELKRIRHLLRDQKPWVGAYSDSQQGYFLASETFAVVASDRENVCRQMLNHDYVKFALLPEGSMLRIDSVVMNAATKKDDLVYQFLDYLFSYDVLLGHAEQFCMLPTTKETFQDLDQKYIGVSNLYPGSTEFNKLIMFNLTLTQKEINDFWIRFKAS